MMAVSDSIAVPAGTLARRRRNQKSVNRILFYGTLLGLGTIIGSAVGIHSFIIARYAFGARSFVLSYLWWLTILATTITMFAVKSQMDSIRETVFEKKVDGRMQQYRLRRRPEVIATVIKRAMFASLVAICMVGVINMGIQRYAPSVVHGGPAGACRGIPPVSDDVFAVVFSFVTGAVTLLISEMALRVSSKAGFRYQAICLFLPASVSVGLSIRYIEGFIN